MISCLCEVIVWMELTMALGYVEFPY